MRLFYIAPWPAADPLTTSTVVPHLLTLAQDPCLAELTFFSCEKEGDNGLINHNLAQPILTHIHHRPLSVPSAPSLPLLRRIQHHKHLSATLIQSARHQKPDLVICRGTTGIFGDQLQRHLGIPYVVESFEPHAHYMLQTGTWRRWDPKYLVQRRWEERVKRNASALITVSHGYARHLREREGISPSRVRTVPCWVDADRFRVDPQARSQLRQQLGIGDRLAVVYAGKFGGIYSPLSELAMLRDLQHGFGQPLFVMLLTSADVGAVHHHLTQAGFAADQVFVQRVAHDQVNAYLNAADLALSFINSGPWSFACSAIKHGEYWACGLPVLMTPAVGDEADWLENEQAGAIASFNDSLAVRAAAERLTPILTDPGHRHRIRSIGLRERGPASLLSTYRWLLDRFALASGGPA